MCHNVFNAKPKTTLLPVWHRDAKRLDIPVSLKLTPTPANSHRVYIKYEPSLFTRTLFFLPHPQYLKGKKVFL